MLEDPIKTLTCLMAEASRGGNGATGHIVKYSGADQLWGHLVTPDCLKFLEEKEVSLPLDYRKAKAWKPDKDEPEESALMLKILQEGAQKLPDGPSNAGPLQSGAPEDLNPAQEGFGMAPGGKETAPEEDDVKDGQGEEDDEMTPEELAAFREAAQARSADEIREAKYRYAVKCMKDYHDKCDEASKSFRTASGEVSEDGGWRTRQSDAQVIAHAIHAYDYYESECEKDSARCKPEVLDVSFDDDDDEDNEEGEEEKEIKKEKEAALAAEAKESERQAEEDSHRADEIDETIDRNLDAFS